MLGSLELFNNYSTLNIRFLKLQPLIYQDMNDNKLVDHLHVLYVTIWTPRAYFKSIIYREMVSIFFLFFKQLIQKQTKKTCKT